MPHRASVHCAQSIQAYERIRWREGSQALHEEVSLLKILGRLTARKEGTDDFGIEEIQEFANKTIVQAIPGDAAVHVGAPGDRAPGGVPVFRDLVTPAGVRLMYGMTMVKAQASREGCLHTAEEIDDVVAADDPATECTAGKLQYAVGMHHRGHRIE